MLKDIEFCASEEELILKQSSINHPGIVFLFVLCNTAANFPDPKSVNGQTESPFRNVGFDSFHREMSDIDQFKRNKKHYDGFAFFVVENFPRLGLDPKDKLADFWDSFGKYPIESTQNNSSVFFDG